MTENVPGAPMQQSWLQTVGRRNLGYIGFVIVLIPVANVLEASGPSGPDAGGGIVFGLIVWALVSVAYFVVNAILMVMALAKRGNVSKPLIACLLPIAVVVATLMAEEIWLN